MHKHEHHEKHTKITSGETLKVAVDELYEVFADISGESLKNKPMIRYIWLKDTSAQQILALYHRLKKEGVSTLDLQGPVNVEFDHLNETERRKFANRKPFYKIKFKKTDAGDPLLHVQLRLSNGRYDELAKVLHDANYLGNSFVDKTAPESYAKSISELYDIMVNLGHEKEFLHLFHDLYKDAITHKSRNDLDVK